MKTYRNVIGWLLSLYLAYEFALSSIGNLTAKPKNIASFHTFGYPLWFMFLTGAIELLCALLVLVPRFAAYGAALIVCVMLGAIFSHATHAQYDKISWPATLAICALILALVRAPRWSPAVHA
jgi:uncharacterized membrane protein YphA (DoxX/SURF4 family)